MTTRFPAIVAVVLLAGACGPADQTPATDADTAAAGAIAGSMAAATGPASLACQPAVENMALEGRASPYDSTAIVIGDAEARLCYGRPSVRGRQIFGGALVPFDTIWRTGANEPTTLHLPFPAEVAGIQVQPGSYTLYTIPRPQEWTVIVNGSIEQWGIESQYTDEIRAEEIGRAQVASEQLSAPVEMFTITSEPAGADAANLVLTWENTRVTIPIRRVG
jgi:hypothetical protein